VHPALGKGEAERVRLDGCCHGVARVNCAGFRGGVRGSLNPQTNTTPGEPGVVEEKTYEASPGRCVSMIVVMAMVEEHEVHE